MVKPEVRAKTAARVRGISLFIFQFLVRFDDMERFSMTSS
jgi:hypothetical protein